MVKKVLLILPTLVIAIAILLTFQSAVHAATGVKTAGECGKSSTFFLMPTWYKHLSFDADCNVQLSQQIVTDSGINNSFDYSVIWRIGTAVIEMLLILAGLVAFVFVVMGAFQFVTTQGSPEKVAKARITLTNGIVGALIAILASRVVGYIANKFSAGGDTAYGLVNAGASQSTVTTAFNIALTVLGAISVLVLVISGIQFIVSSSNPDKVAKARNAIYYALTGIAVAIFGAALINFIIGRVA